MQSTPKNKERTKKKSRRNSLQEQTNDRKGSRGNGKPKLTSTGGQKNTRGRKGLYSWKTPRHTGRGAPCRGAKFRVHSIVEKGPTGGLTRSLEPLGRVR